MIRFGHHTGVFAFEGEQISSYEVIPALTFSSV